MRTEINDYANACRLRERQYAAYDRCAKKPRMNMPEFAIHVSECATLEILGNANGCAFRHFKHKGLREGCHCIENRDIGVYDTCTNGCRSLRQSVSAESGRKR